MQHIKSTIFCTALLCLPMLSQATVTVQINNNATKVGQATVNYQLDGGSNQTLNILSSKPNNMTTIVAMHKQVVMSVGNNVCYNDASKAPVSKQDVRYIASISTNVGGDVVVTSNNPDFTCCEMGTKDCNPPKY